MKFAKDFRDSARAAIKGKWGLAVGGGLLASIFGVGGGTGLTLNFNSGDSTEVEEIEGLSGAIEQHLPLIIGILGIVLFFGLVFGLAWSAVASTVNVGYCRYNLEFIDGKPPMIATIFSYFSHFWKAFASEFLRNLYIFLWTLLFIIPGIIATYNYALVPYIIAEDTQISVSDALRKSKELMYGNRWRLFCLEFSFIGWHLLAVVTFGISSLWVNPYQAVAVADFYREISGTRPVIEPENESDFADISEQAPQF